MAVAATGLLASRLAMRQYAIGPHAKKMSKVVVTRLRKEAAQPKSATSLERKMGMRRASKPLEASSPYLGAYFRRPASATSSGSGAAQGGYQQLASVKVKSGRKSKLSKVATTLQRKNICVAQTQFKNIGQFTGDYGTLSVNHRNVTSASRRDLPVYMMDLTHLWGGLATMHRLGMYTAAGANDGKMGWFSVQGVNDGGSSAFIPHFKYTSPNFPVSTFPNRVHVGASEIKLNLYGCKTRPTKFTLSLVRFKKDNYCPLNDQATAEQNTLDELGTAFWQSRVKRLVANPIADQYRVNGSDMQVIARRVYDIAPTSTTESDPDPHCITVNWTHDINRVVNLKKYQAVDTDDVNVVNANLIAKDQPSTQISANYTPFAKDRVYLLIEATAWTPLAEADAQDANTSPSLEYNFKTTFRCDV